MPELPEVENVCRGLQQILNSSPLVKKVHVQTKRLRFPLGPQFARVWQGSHVNEISRRAKYIIFDLGEHVVLNHLGMTGSWRSGHVPFSKKHDHLALELSSGAYLIYNDPRRFGYFSVQPKLDLNRSKWFRHLGVEPLSESLNADFMYQVTRGRAVPIKNFLMDQRHIVGVGNIYASEALFIARISPLRRARTLRLDECARLVDAIKSILSESIASGGTTLRDYRTVYGEVGEFAQALKVYGRIQQNCYVCKRPIQKIVQGGRSTFWCKKCQR